MEGPTSSLREQGIQALREGNLDAAVDLLVRSVMADGQDVEAQAFLGVAYSQKGLHPQARQALETAVALRPQEARYRFNLGVALAQAGDRDGAAAAFQETVRLNPEHAQAKARLQALGAPVGAAPAASPWAPAGASSSPTFQPGGAGPAQPMAGGPPGTVQCPSCRQWSRPGMSCEWCSAALKPAAAPPSAPWLQPGYGAMRDSPAVDLGVSVGPDMAPGEAFWRRFAASFIDGVLVQVVTSALGFMIGISVGMSAGAGGRGPGAEGIFAVVQGLSFILGLMIGVAYYAGMLTWRGQTLGKMALGIRVVGADGGHPTFGKAVLRELIGKMVSGIVLCLGYLWMLWDPQQQTWHDKMAGTYVVRA